MSIAQIHRDYDGAINGRHDDRIDPLTGIRKDRLLQIYDSIRTTVTEHKEMNETCHMYDVAHEVLVVMNENPQSATLVAECFLRHEEVEGDYDMSLDLEVRGMIQRGSAPEAVFAAINDIHDAGTRERLRNLLAEQNVEGV